MMIVRNICALVLAIICLMMPVYSDGLPRSESTQNASVYIIEPKDGDVVSSPVKVVFGLSGMGVSPAGIEKQNTGHHHLLIDVESVKFDEPVKKDENHIHFGGGQTETNVELSTGQHTLQLLLADHFHIPHNSPVASEKITITVE